MLEIELFDIVSTPRAFCPNEYEHTKHRLKKLPVGRAVLAHVGAMCHLVRADHRCFFAEVSDG